MSKDWRRALALEVMSWLEIADGMDIKPDPNAPEILPGYSRKDGWIEAALIVSRLKWYLPVPEKPEVAVHRIITMLETRCNEIGSTPEFVEKYGKYRYARFSYNNRHWNLATSSIASAADGIRYNVLSLVCHHKYKWKQYYGGEYEPPEDPFWECEECELQIGMPDDCNEDLSVSFENLSEQGAMDYYDNYGKAPRGTPTASFLEWISDLEWVSD